MEMKTVLQTLLAKQDLSRDAMTDIMRRIMQGQVDDCNLAAFLIALESKTVHVDELTASAAVIRELAPDFPIQANHLVDIVGTGGDGSHLFNVSTSSAFVIAAAGASVAKHLGGSVSSKSGSADLLQQAGIELALTPAQIQHCVSELGLGFIFAAQHHQSFRHVTPVRKALGIRTLFNLLGPLTNPAPVKRHLIGVFSEQWLEPFAKVLNALGSERALIVHAKDGLDEISIAAPTKVVSLDQGRIEHYTITPEDFGLQSQPLDSLRVTNATESLQHLQSVLANETGPARDMVTLNAGAAIYVAGLSDNLADGIQKASDTISSGAAQDKLQQLITLTTALAKEST